jgi:hypothetical protein
VRFDEGDWTQRAQEVIMLGAGHGRERNDVHMHTHMYASSSISVKCQRVPRCCTVHILAYIQVVSGAVDDSINHQTPIVSYRTVIKSWLRGRRRLREAGRGTGKTVCARGDNRRESHGTDRDEKGHNSQF